MRLDAMQRRARPPGDLREVHIGLAGRMAVTGINFTDQRAAVVMSEGELTTRRGTGNDKLHRRFRPGLVARIGCRLQQPISRRSCHRCARLASL